jgi:hypothetical protein
MGNLHIVIETSELFISALFCKDQSLKYYSEQLSTPEWLFNQLTGFNEI